MASLDGRAEFVLVDASALDGGFFKFDDLDRLSVGEGQDRRELTLAGAHGWIRRLATPQWRPGVTAGSREAAERSAHTALIVGLASHPGVEWLTPYAHLVAVENKLRQAVHARRLGIRTPRTVVVSDPNQIPRELGDVLVAKPLGPGQFVDDCGEAWVIWATQIARADERLDALGGAPFLLQERLIARRHLRVVTCGARAWTCALNARDLPVDWRRDDAAHHAFVAAKEPRVETLAVALARDLGAGYSSQDWIDDGTVEPAFLDLNPAGQWLFLPEPISGDVTNTIAGHLAGAQN